MSAPHPLNQAVVTQALNDLRTGQLRRGRAMGFSEQALNALKNPAFASLLTHAPLAWCSVKVNTDIVDRLLRQAHAIESEVAVIDHMLILGASSEMIGEHFGLSNQEIATRRQVLDLPPHKGRWPVLTADQDDAIWDRFQREVQTLGIDTQDDRAVLSGCATVAESLDLPMAAVWSLVRKWLADVAELAGADPRGVSSREAPAASSAADPTP